nr:MAG TPA: hypothetical protein [Caudoviricetes sp.]
MKINPMAKIFKNRIKDGIMTLDEVPERWREATRELLKESTLNPYTLEHELIDRVKNS